MKAHFKDQGVSVEVDLGQVEPEMLHTLWLAAVKHGCHIQLPAKLGQKTLLLNVRSLNTELTFDEILVPSNPSLPPKPIC